MAKFDREKFNTDPKHEEERNQFDTMLEDSLNRRIRKEAESRKRPAPAKGFFESLFPDSDSTEDEGNVFDAIFGRKK